MKDHNSITNDIHRAMMDLDDPLYIGDFDFGDTTDYPNDTAMNIVLFLILISPLIPIIKAVVIYLINK
jgi:hypothetical protein